MLFKKIEAIISPIKQKGSFAQNIFVSFSGTAFVTLIGILLTPVMTRIYPPASYGQVAVFNSVSNNLITLSLLAYNSAIPLPESKQKAFSIIQLTVVLSLFFFGITMMAMLLFGDQITALLHVEEMANWFYALPLLVLLFNLTLVMSSWYTRIKEFRTRANVEVATAVTGRAFTIGLGWISHGHPASLIVGDVVTKITSFIGLFRSGIHLELKELRYTFSWKNIKDVAAEYKEFPLYMLPGSYITALSAQLPIYFLTSSFGSVVVGLYSFSVTMLELPVSLTGSAMAPVFYQKASELFRNDYDKLKELTLNLYNKLLYVGVVPLGILTVYGDWLFKIAFGAKWEMAGVYTGYLGYYYIFKLTSQSTSTLYSVLSRQRYLLFSNILLLLVRAGALALGIYMRDVNLTLLFFGLGSLVCIFLIDMHILHLVGLPAIKIALRTIIILSITLFSLKVTRYAFEYFFPEFVVRYL
jgi:O-antigen/teichoic acid export membrane protein